MRTHSSNQPGLRDRKKAETRLAISNIATRLFVEHGFENVSVDDIAREAAVARKTVFNYFPRKEDLVFDREEEVRTLVREALASRGTQSPIDAFQTLMRTLVKENHPLFRMTDRTVQFWRTVAKSPALTTRARELQVTFADDLSDMLADAADRPKSDPDVRLAAAMQMDTLVIAYREALRAFGEKQEPAPAFVSVMERGFIGVNAAFAGTPLSDSETSRR
jgi:AcrR family transcriptional regulator